jgi:LysR family transcriptional regulator, cyn operon transcriptional activator
MIHAESGIPVMNLRALRTFVTTADSGGLGRASERLHLSQPAASRQIRALEAELGIALFQRDGRGLRLTPEGEDLLRQCRRLLVDADLIADRARTLKGGRTGILRIAATPHVIAGVLAPFIGRHAGRHPGVEAQLVEGGAAQQPRRLEDGEVHLAIMPAGDDRFGGRLLYPVHALAVMPDAHELATRPVLDVGELSDRAILLLRREFGSRAWFDAACEIAHAKPRVRLESAAPQTLIELAAAGYGIAILPSTAVIQRAGIHAVPVTQRGASLGRWSMVAWDRHRLLPRYAEGFVAELVAQVRRGHPGREFTRRAPPMPRPREPVE